MYNDPYTYLACGCLILLAFAVVLFANANDSTGDDQ